VSGFQQVSDGLDDDGRGSNHASDLTGNTIQKFILRHP
jgi:hypothetical protein